MGKFCGIVRKGEVYEFSVIFVLLVVKASTEVAGSPVVSGRLFHTRRKTMKKVIIAIVIIIACAHSAPAQEKLGEWTHYTHTDAFDGETFTTVDYFDFTDRGNAFLLRARRCTRVYLGIEGFIFRDIDRRDEIRVIFDGEKPAWYSVVRKGVIEKRWQELTFYGKNRQLIDKMLSSNSMKIEVFLHRKERHIIYISLAGFSAEYAKLRC